MKRMGKGNKQHDLKLLQHIPGHRYEICVNCGLEWNVSLNAPLGWYICPKCEGKLRRQGERRAIK